MPTLFIDLESYYDRQYSLTRMTTVEYVCSPFFECYLASWAIDESPMQLAVGPEQVARLMQALPWGKLIVVIFNVHFDAAITAWRYRAPPPMRWACAMAAMRIAHPEWRRHSLKFCSEQLGLPAKGDAIGRMCGVRWAKAPETLRQEMMAYAIRDTENLREIWRRRPHELDGVEGDYLDQTVRLWTEPALGLDMDTLVSFRNQVSARDIGALARIERYGITREILFSDIKLASALTNLGYDVPTKVSPASGKLVPAFAKTDLSMQEWVGGDHGPILQEVAAARLGLKSTLERSRVERLIAVAGVTGGVLPAPLVFGNTNTGRLAGGDKLNLQNLKGGTHPLRKAIRAPDGHLLVYVDAAQVECRLLAWWAGEVWLNECFAKGLDPYCLFGEDLFGRVITRADWQRKYCKAAVLSCGYGISDLAFYARLQAQGLIKELPPGEEPMALAVKLVSHYRTKNSRTTSLWRACRDMLGVLAGTAKAIDVTTGKPSLLPPQSEVGVVKFSSGRITLPSGRSLIYPGIAEGDDGYYWTRRGFQNKLYGAKLVENVCQALARDHVMSVWARVRRNYPWIKIRIALQVHDDLTAVVPADRADEAVEIMQKEMSTAPAWAPGLILGAEAASGLTLADVK